MIRNVTLLSRRRSIRRWGTLSSNQSDRGGAGGHQIASRLVSSTKDSPDFQGARYIFTGGRGRPSSFPDRGSVPLLPHVYRTLRVAFLPCFTSRAKYGSSLSLLGSLSKSESQLSEATHAAAGEVRLSLSIFRPKQRRHNAEETARTKKTKERLNE